MRSQLLHLVSGVAVPAAGMPSCSGRSWTAACTSLQNAAASFFQQTRAFTVTTCTAGENDSRSWKGKRRLGTFGRTRPPLAEWTASRPYYQAQNPATKVWQIPPRTAAAFRCPPSKPQLQLLAEKAAAINNGVKAAQ